MAKKSAFYTYIMEEIFSPFPGITSRKMFNGYGIYKEGLIFAIIADDHLYFRADEYSAQQFKELGCAQFFYRRKGRKILMPYYELPEYILEDKHALGNWIQKSLFASMRKKRVAVRHQKGDNN